MHLPFTVHTHARQMYVCDNNIYKAQCVLRFITWMIVLISVQDDGTVNVLQRMNYLIKGVFSKRYTFLCYRASQSRSSTRRSPFTIHVKRILYSGKVWRGESLANWLFSRTWRKKVWQINRLANRLLIVSTNLDGFNLANHRRFAKFAKLFRYMVVLSLYLNSMSGLFNFVY